MRSWQSSRYTLLSLALAAYGACASETVGAEVKHRRVLSGSDDDGPKFGAGSITACVLAGLFVLMAAKAGFFKIELRDLAELQIDARSFWL